MPARYATGTYATPHALLNAIDVFLVNTLGWTRNMGPTTVAGKSGKRAHYQKSITKGGVSRTVYWNILAPGASEVQGSSSSETYVQAVYSYPSTGFDAGLAWDRQPGYPIAQTGGLGLFPASAIPLVNDPPLRYAFSGNAYGDAYLVFERVSNGVNAHLTAGVLDKSSSGAYDGGEFAGAGPGYQSNWSSSQVSELPWDSDYYPMVGLFVRATVDGVTDWVSIQRGYSATESLTLKTRLLGIGNLSFTSAANYSARISSLPNFSKSCPSLNTSSGVIIPKLLQCAVLRATGRLSVLGEMPLVKYCPIVADEGIPWGTVIGSKLYTRQLEMELRDE